MRNPVSPKIVRRKVFFLNFTMPQTPSKEGPSPGLQY